MSKLLKTQINEKKFVFGILLITKTLDLLYFLYKHKSIFQHLLMEKSSKNQIWQYLGLLLPQEILSWDPGAQIDKGKSMIASATKICPDVWQGLLLS